METKWTEIKVESLPIEENRERRLLPVKPVASINLELLLLRGWIWRFYGHGGRREYSPLND